MIIKTIINIDTFKNKLSDLFSEYDIDLDENTGRRNALLSAIQEKCLAEQLGFVYEGVKNDGAPGMPDIVIGEIKTELECKLTSGSGKKSRSYSLQTDYATIQNKKSLDYIYFISNEKMTEYCVLYFKGLTAGDFYEPPETARGKARMNKKLGFKKAIPLVGGFKNLNEEHIENYETKIKNENNSLKESLSSMLFNIEEFLEKCKMSKLVTSLKQSEERAEKKIQTSRNKQEMWSKKDPSYSLVFERFDKIKEEINEECKDK
tara:strand:- start:1123 stop:1908 length:786 start_codon:yes stop_codon:yes gene_type:complete